MAEEKTFYEYFKQNMKELGLPAPESLFGSLSTATGTIGAMATYIKTYGTSATVAEMVGTLSGGAAGAGGGAVGTATALSEVLLVVGALSAAFYVGACIGSLAVATGKKLSGGLSISDLIIAANAHGIRADAWLGRTIQKNPALINSTHRDGRVPLSGYAIA